MAGIGGLHPHQMLKLDTSRFELRALGISNPTSLLESQRACDALLQVSTPMRRTRPYL